MQAGPSYEVQRINESFPKIDNLEYFPQNVLLQIFGHVDDIALLNLAENSERFGAIAKVVFKMKYTNGDYFVMDGESEHHRDLYTAIFKRMNGHTSVDAIALQSIRNINGHHWTADFLRNMTNLQKLSFDKCSFQNAHEFLSRHMNITHLSIRHNPRRQTITVPDFRKLIGLELSGVDSGISFAAVNQIISHNPSLESLILRHDAFWTLSAIIATISEHLTNLKEVILIGANAMPRNELPQPTISVARAVDAFKHIKRFGLTVKRENAAEMSSIKLLKQLGERCKNIDQLELDVPNFEEICDELTNALDGFKNVDSFSVELFKYNDDAVDAMIGHLPKLRRLRIELNHQPNAYINKLNWLPRYPSIERLTIAHTFSDSMFVANVRYFMALQASIADQHIDIEFEEDGQIIGRITAETIVWRNKLLHWIGWAPSLNSSQANLLSLNSPDPQPRVSPFEVIIDYLCLKSLYCLAMVNAQCRQLVENFIRRRSEAQEPFSITNEFSQHYEPEVFAHYVNNLTVYNFGSTHDAFQLSQIIKRHYNNVRKLCTVNDLSDYGHLWVYEPVRHFICKSLKTYTALRVIHDLCPDLEILECTNEIVEFHYNLPPFRNLTRFTFKFSDDAILHALRKMFQNSTTVLDPIT